MRAVSILGVGAADGRPTGPGHVRRSMTFFAGALMAWACGDDASRERLPPVAWESAHFRYAAWPDDQSACSDVMAVLEEHWTFWHARLGLPDPGRPVILYVKVKDIFDLPDGVCPDLAAACTTDTTIRADVLFDKHELIHAYLAETSPPPVALFAEGAAVAFSCDAGVFSASGTTPPWRELLAPEFGSPEGYATYPRGGQLVSHLVSTFGAEAFVRFYRSVAPLDDADAIADAFLASFGRTLDEVWPEATRPGSPMCLAPWECSRSPLALDGTPQRGQPVCGRSLVASAFQIPSDMNATLSFRDTPSNLGLSTACGDSSKPGSLHLYPGGTFDMVSALVAGTYLVNLGTGELTGTPLTPAAIGTSCAGLVPYSVPDNGQRLVVAATERHAYARLRFNSPRSATLIGELGGVTPATTIWNCPDCSTDANTCPVATGASLRSTFEGDLTWVMQVQSGWVLAHLYDQ